MHPTAPKLTPQKIKLLHFMSLPYEKFGFLVLQPLGNEGFVEEFQEYAGVTLYYQIKGAIQSSHLKLRIK